MQLVDHLEYEVADGILWVRFNRPERMNAIAPDTVQRVAEYLEAGDQDPDVRVMVLTGNGRGFCAGADMKAMASGESRIERGVDDSRQHFTYYFQQCFRRISETKKPTIAMVNGPAAGAGLDMSLHCDLRIGCENTRFFTYQNVGQIIENGGFYFLPRIVGYGRAMELAYTGGWLGAEEAHRWGLLNRLVPAENLRDETIALCHRIMAGPPLVQWIGKRIMRRALDTTLEGTLEMCANASGILSAAEDSLEARRAFAEQRPPRFAAR